MLAIPVDKVHFRARDDGTRPRSPSSLPPPLAPRTITKSTQGKVDLRTSLRITRDRHSFSTTCTLTTCIAMPCQELPVRDLT